jgi:hypothetical protein
MIGTHNYVLYTNDTAFLETNWDGYLLAMDFIYGKVTYASGLLDVTGIRDWARWQQGYNNTEAQMMYDEFLLDTISLKFRAKRLQPLPHPKDWSRASNMGRGHYQPDQPVELKSRKSQASHQRILLG